LLTAFKRKITSLELVPAAGGCFELAIGAQLLYSKLATGEFPNEEEMVRLVGKRLLEDPNEAQRAAAMRGK